MEVRWVEQSLADVPSDDAWLSPAEKRRCEGFHIPKRRADWRLGRWTAKRAVAAYLRVPCQPGLLTRLEVRAAVSGAPEAFLDDDPAKVSISITHCDGIAACAIAPSKMTIGCDLELIELRSDAFLRDYFTASEQLLVMRGSAFERAINSTLLWSAKESALKALKAGLRFDTRSVEVSLGEGSHAVAMEDIGPGSLSIAERHVWDWRQLIVSHASSQHFRGWWISSGRLVRTVVTVPPSTAPKHYAS
jgi:4'-phosphopantetheinyl transferase